MAVAGVIPGSLLAPKPATANAVVPSADVLATAGVAESIPAAGAVTNAFKLAGNNELMALSFVKQALSRAAPADTSDAVRECFDNTVPDLLREAARIRTHFKTALTTDDPKKNAVIGEDADSILAQQRRGMIEVIRNVHAALQNKLEKKDAFKNASERGSASFHLTSIADRLKHIESNQDGVADNSYCLTGEMYVAVFNAEHFVDIPKPQEALKQATAPALKKAKELEKKHELPEGALTSLLTANENYFMDQMQHSSDLTRKYYKPDAPGETLSIKELMNDDMFFKRLATLTADTVLGHVHPRSYIGASVASNLPAKMDYVNHKLQKDLQTAYKAAFAKAFPDIDVNTIPLPVLNPKTLGAINAAYKECLTEMTPDTTKPEVHTPANGDSKATVDQQIDEKALSARPPFGLSTAARVLKSWVDKVSPRQSTETEPSISAPSADIVTPALPLADNQTGITGAFTAKEDERIEAGKKPPERS